MKKSRIILTVLFLVLLTACSPTVTDPLSYQDRYPYTAKGALNTGSTEYCFEIEMTGAGKATITFSSPETLRGYVFKVSESGATLSYDDLTIDFNGGGEKTNVVMLLPSLFSINRENSLSSESGIVQNGVTLTKAVYSTENGNVTVYVNEQTKKPMCFESGSVRVDITDFTENAASGETPSPTPTNTPGNAPDTTEAPPHTANPDNTPAVTPTPTSAPTAE